MANIKNNNVGSKRNRLLKKQQKRMKTIKQLAIQSPKLIKRASRKINEIIKMRIDLQTGNVECKLPEIIRKSIEVVYQTPFRLLSKFGAKQFKKSE